MGKDDEVLLAKAAVFEETVLKLARAIELELERVETTALQLVKRY